MDRIKVERDAFVLDGKEVIRLRELLNYCKHRATEHPESYLAKCSWSKDFIKYLLEVM